MINVQTALSGGITRFGDGKAVEEFHREAGDVALAGVKSWERMGLAA